MAYRSRDEDFGGKTPGGYIQKMKPGDSLRIRLGDQNALITFGKNHISIAAARDIEIEDVADKMEIGSYTYELDDTFFVKTPASEVREGDSIIRNGREEKIKTARRITAD